MRIKEFRVEKLFGYLDYTIPLKDESIAILHGPNGCGKTTILKLLRAVMNIDVATLRRLSFQELTITFFDSNVLKVTRSKRESAKPSNAKRRRQTTFFEVQFWLVKNAGPEEHYKPDQSPESRQLEFPLSLIQHHVPHLVRTGPDVWLDQSTGLTLGLEDIGDIYSDALPGIARREHPQWLKAISSALSPHLIQTQRLLRIDSSAPQGRYPTNENIKASEVVDIYSAEIKDLISKKLAESVSIAQSRDRTFPNRLLGGQTNVQLSESEIRTKFSELEDRRKRLISAGLLGDEEQGVPLPEKEMDDMEKKVLGLYISDIEKKLEIFDDLQTRIQTFMEIINFKFQPKGKSINISRQNGFLFESKHGDKSRLDAKELSSGEQHEIVLFYELLFKTGNGALILIDEPEISLHVNWQRVFLGDLEKIVKLTSHNIVIATHSPQIISNRWDLAVALDGGVRDET